MDSFICQKNTYHATLKSIFILLCHQYINHLRLEHARQLLEESATSVTEVAMCSGYQNVSYFIYKLQRKCMGYHPLKYRKSFLYNLNIGQRD